MRITLAGLLVAVLAPVAGANGRDPYASTINFERGNDQHIVAGMTFGMVRSDDGGVTWRWMCERTIGYGGMYDPDYVYSNTGAVFATTFDGLKVMRDGCSFNATPPGTTFVSRVEQGGDGAIYYAASDTTVNDSKIYKSTDDGMTFPTSTSPGQVGDWWQGIMVAPSDPSVIYLSGYRLQSMQPKLQLFFKSTNGGTSFSPISVASINTLTDSSTLDIVGISPTDPNIVYVRTTFTNTTSGDAIWRWNGSTWTLLLSKDSKFGPPQGLSFLARKNGTCIAGTRELGAWISPQCDTTWNPLNGAPHIGCLAQDSTGVVYACTQNYDSPQLNLPSDGDGIMKSSDLVTWQGVLKFQEIKEPVSCAAGTVQHDQCVEPYNGQGSVWCCLISQLGITSTAIDCSGARACYGPADTPPDGTVKPPKGCCDNNVSGPPALLTVLVAYALLLRGRRRKER